MPGQLKGVRAAIVGGLLVMPVIVSGCGTGVPELIGLGQVIDEIDKARTTIADESGAWRNELQKLSSDLDAMRSRVARDVKDVITGASNQVADLATQTIQFTDAKVQDRIAQAGAEFRCNVDFVKASVKAELQYLVDDLKFWEKEKKHKNTPPVHGNCWVTPSALSLYQTNDGDWAVDPANMSDKGVIHLFGYAYRSEALPTVTLQDMSGAVIRAAATKPAYVTRYQINLDVSAENFAGVRAGSRLVLNWPDTANDATTITLAPRPRAKLQIQAALPTLAAPKAMNDPVNLDVTILNTGGETSQPFNVTWTPDPSPGSPSYTVRSGALKANEPVTLHVGPHTFARAGDIDGTISISDSGADSRIVHLHVLPAPPPLEKSLDTGDGNSIHVKVEHNAVAPDQVEFRLEPGPGITWWKAVFVPVTQGADIEPRTIQVLGGQLPILVTSANGAIVAHVASGTLTGGYRGFQMQDGSTAGGTISIGSLDRSRPLIFAKAKGFNQHWTLPFTWNALRADEIDPLDGSRVTLTWARD